MKYLYVLCAVLLSIFLSVEVLYAQVAGGEYTIISRSPTGEYGNLDSYGEEGAVSDDGRYIVFASKSSNIAGGKDSEIKLFLYDSQTSTIKLVTKRNDGTDSEFSGTDSSISSDGKYVLFSSSDDGIVGEDYSYNTIVFRYNTVSDQAEVVSLDINGEWQHIHAYDPRMSGDGNYVVFASPQDVTDNPDIGERSIYLRNISAGVTELVSISSEGVPANNTSQNADVSDDGRFIVYDSNAINLVSDDTDFTTDVYLYDRISGQSTLVSKSYTGGPGNGYSHKPVISGDGRYIAYISIANDIVEDDTPTSFGASRLYLYDRITDSTVWIIPDRDEGDFGSNNPSISDNGRYIVFDSLSPLPNSGKDEALGVDIFIYDNFFNVTQRLPSLYESNPADRLSVHPKISSNGRVISYSGEVPSEYPQQFVHTLPQEHFTQLFLPMISR